MQLVPNLARTAILGTRLRALGGVAASAIINSMLGLYTLTTAFEKVMRTAGVLSVPGRHAGSPRQENLFGPVRPVFVAHIF